MANFVSILEAVKPPPTAIPPPANAPPRSLLDGAIMAMNALMATLASDGAVPILISAFPGNPAMLASIAMMIRIALVLSAVTETNVLLKRSPTAAVNRGAALGRPVYAMEMSWWLGLEDARLTHAIRKL